MKSQHVPVILTKFNKMKHSNNIASLLILTLLLIGCNNRICQQSKLIEKSKNTNFKIFEFWDIEPRDEMSSSAYLMKYVAPYSNEQISMVVYAVNHSPDSNEYKLSIKEVNRTRFCYKNGILDNQIDNYIDSVFTSFIKLNVSSLQCKQGVCLIKLGNCTLLNYELEPTESVIAKLDTLGYYKISPGWYGKIKK